MMVLHVGGCRVGFSPPIPSDLTANLNGYSNVELKGYAVLADAGVFEQLWPQP